MNVHSVDLCHLCLFANLKVDAFALELCKGNPRNIELLFCSPESAAVVAPEWTWLHDIRDIFLTRRCVRQYKGFVADRLARVRRLLGVNSCTDNVRGDAPVVGHHAPLTLADENACAKLFYHAFHKLFDLQRVVVGKEPSVWLPDGHERDFIMSIRTTRPLQGVLDPHVLLKRAEDALHDIDHRSDAVVLPERVELEPLVAALRNFRATHFEPVFTRGKNADGGSGHRDDSARTISRSSTSSTVLRDVALVPDATAIRDRLERAEDAHGVHVIFAAECSSWNLGTAHSGSDHDVVAIFVHRADRYFSLFTPPKALRCSFPGENGEPEVCPCDVCSVMTVLNLLFLCATCIN